MKSVSWIREEKVLGNRYWGLGIRYWVLGNAAIELIFHK
jgi:hypothetical protein